MSKAESPLVENVEEVSLARREERRAPEPETPSRARLDRFYDRLRGRLASRLSDRVGDRLADTLLLAPDLFVLLVRLFFDREVPESSRALVGGALAYFLLPADLLPEALLGAGGFLDDVVLTAAVLSHVFSALEPYVERHWSGRGSVRSAVEDAVTAADALLSERVYDRLVRVLARYGVHLEKAGRGDAREV